jgi:hypothetical protein
MEFVEDNGVPIQDIIDKMTPQDLVKAEEKRTISFNTTSYTSKSPDLRSRILKKKLTF